MFTSESVRLPSVCVTSDQTWHCWNLSYISSPNSKYYLLETLKYVFPEQANIVFPKFLPGEACVTWADRQKKNERMGWHFHQKGQTVKATGQGKEASLQCRAMCVLVWMAFTEFSVWLLSSLRPGICAVQETYWKGQLGLCAQRTL